MTLQTRIRRLCFLRSLLLLGCGSDRPDPMVAGRDLAKGIALQSTQAQVLGYLSGKKVKHSQYLHDSAQGNLIYADIPDTRKLTIVRDDCSIEFRFDDHDRLAKVEVREYLTGP
jgi:hypothetical protein